MCHVVCYYFPDSKVVLPDGRPVPCVLLGNKCDVEDTHAVSAERAEAVAKEKGFAAFYPTSAKDGTNVDVAANFLIKAIMDNQKV